MVSPEIDYWIKNNTQVKNPVYSRKRYATNWVYIFSAKGSSITTSSTLTFPVNQAQNVKLVLCTDYTFSMKQGVADLYFLQDDTIGGSIKFCLPRYFLFILVLICV